MTNNEFLIFFYILFFVRIFIGTGIILIFAKQAMNFMGILLINQWQNNDFSQGCKIENTRLEAINSKNINRYKLKIKN